jgi:hypothetical protein
MPDELDRFMSIPDIFQTETSTSDTATKRDTPRAREKRRKHASAKVGLGRISTRVRTLTERQMRFVLAKTAPPYTGSHAARSAGYSKSVSRKANHIIGGSPTVRRILTWFDRLTHKESFSYRQWERIPVTEKKKVFLAVLKAAPGTTVKIDFLDERK